VPVRESYRKRVNFLVGFAHRILVLFEPRFFALIDAGNAANAFLTPNQEGSHEHGQNSNSDLENGSPCGRNRHTDGRDEHNSHLRLCQTEQSDDNVPGIQPSYDGI
jgi:hypothetical protein